MNFVQFGMLGGLAALAIPVIIHLMFRQRSRPVDLGTLQFLKVVLRANARRRRLRRYLLLALRMACVALFAFLFARPYLLANDPRGGSRLVVVLVDRSASMGLKGGTTPIDRAVAEAGALVRRSGPGTQLEVAAFDQAVRPLARAADLPGLSLKSSAGGTDYGAAMAWARDLCVRSPKPTRELHIFTDLQRSGLDRGESASLPADVDVKLTDLGRAFPRNIAVAGLVLPRGAVRPREAIALAARIRNLTPLPVTKVPVRLHLEAGGTPIDVEQVVDLDGGATKTVSFKTPALAEGLWRGHVEADAGDDLLFDDRRFLALSVAPPTRVLLVDGDPGRSPIETETYYLQAALRLAPPGENYTKAPFDPRTIELSAASGLPDLARTDVVVLANVGNLEAADARALAGFVDRGGGLLVFTGDRIKADGLRALRAAGLGVGTVGGPATAKERPYRIDAWEAGHAIFRPFEDPEHGDLRRPAFTAITRIEADPKSRVLASFRGGEPALLEAPRGRGKVVWFASAADRGWGDWPRGRMYLPMVHQMIAYAAGLAEGGRVRQAIAGGDHAPGITDVDGVCRVTNPDPAESETDRCTPREFADRFGFRLPDQKPPAADRAGIAGTRAGAGRPDERLRGDELWPWLALALVGALLVENFLANRTAA